MMKINKEGNFFDCEISTQILNSDRELFESYLIKSKIEFSLGFSDCDDMENIFVLISYDDLEIEKYVSKFDKWKTKNKMKIFKGIGT